MTTYWKPRLLSEEVFATLYKTLVVFTQGSKLIKQNKTKIPKTKQKTEGTVADVYNSMILMSEAGLMSCTAELKKTSKLTH